MGASIIRPDDPRVSTVPPALEQMLRAADTILELLPVAICICDRHGRFVRYNRRAAETWGRAPAIGETHAAFTTTSRFFRLDGRPLAPDELPMRVALATGQPLHDEKMVVERADGSRGIVEVSVDPLTDADGRVIGATQCFQDITERMRIDAALARYQLDLREHEQRLAATYEHAAIGIVETDAEGHFLRVNEAICAITALTREELLGSSLFARTHPDDVDADREAYNRLVRGEIGMYSIEKRFRRRNGQVIWMAVRSTSVRDEAGRFRYCVRVVQDVTDRRLAEERQKLLIDELNHRVKNTLATVQSLAGQTARNAPTPEAFRKTFEGRLKALSQAHDQLTSRHWNSADLHDIIAAGTGAYLGHGEGRVSIEGERTTLRPRAALTLAMTFHELTTNAAKYGALSNATGRIEVRWTIEPEPDPGEPPLLRIVWREQGGPPVARPARRGFGTKFIAGSIASELGGTAHLGFEPEGLTCTLQIPLSATVEEAAAPASARGTGPGTP